MRELIRETMELYKETCENLGPVPQDIEEAFRAKGLDLDLLPARVRKPFLVLAAFIMSLKEPNAKNMVNWLYLATLLISQTYEEEVMSS
jgi:hypothetical protein